MYYRVTNYFDPIGQRRIPCKCPECGNTNSLELQFFQQRSVSTFTEKTSQKVSGLLYCYHNQKEIPPVLWTDEIERYFNIEKSKQKLAPSSFKFSKYIKYSFAITMLGLLSFFGYSFYEKQQFKNHTAAMAQVTVGNKVKTLYTVIPKNMERTSGTTWFLVKKIVADTVWLQRNKDYNSIEDFEFNLDNDSFNAEILKVSLERLKQKGVYPYSNAAVLYSGYVTEIK